MAIVTFWNDTGEQCGTTSSSIALATQVAYEHNMKVLLISTGFNDEIVKDSFWVEKKKNRWQVNQILETSNQRLKRCCPQFERCGGCQFQHASRDLEYTWKQEKIESLFPKYKVEPIIRYEEDHYRHKVIATFAMNKNKKITAGIYEEDSHRVCPVQDCRIQHEKVNTVLLVLTVIDC